MNDLKQYDTWLADGGPAALVIREHLVPVDGPDGVFFPATFAAAEDKRDFAGGYNIDEWEEGGKTRNACLIDSIGSQANRIEPLFIKEPLRDLVPQITVKAGTKVVNLLEAGHRAGDAIVRCSALQERLRSAFQEVLKGDAQPLAKVAPTSLVFGVWDSRDTQAKLPRLLASSIRAYDVVRLHRSAQYNPAIDYVASQVMDDPADKKTNDAYSERGFKHVPATWSHGGIKLVAGGVVRRDATLSLAALRLLAVREGGGAINDDRTLALRRYILGLTLVAFTAQQGSYLRQGCQLVPDIEKPRETTLVHGDGKRESSAVSHDHALAYARAAAKAFGVGANEEVSFDKQRAMADIKGENTTISTKSTRSKKAQAATTTTGETSE